MKALNLNETKAVTGAGIIGKIITHIVVNQAVKHGLKKIIQPKNPTNPLQMVPNP